MEIGPSSAQARGVNEGKQRKSPHGEEMGPYAPMGPKSTCWRWSQLFCSRKLHLSLIHI